MCDTKQGQQLRSSLRKTFTGDQKGSRDPDPDKHVRFACPKDSNSTFQHHPQLPSMKATPNESNENAEGMSPVQRKRNITLEGSCEQDKCIKKNKPNERIIRLSQALEALLHSSKLKEIDSKIEESRKDAEALLDRALLLADAAITQDISMHELKVLAEVAVDRHLVINEQRQKDIQRVEAAFSSANELLSEMELCLSTVATSVEGECEDGSGMPSIESEIDALIRDVDVCRELQNKIANFHI